MKRRSHEQAGLERLGARRARAARAGKLRYAGGAERADGGVDGHAAVTAAQNLYLRAAGGQFLKDFNIGPTAALVRAIDYCGVRSGRDESKFEAMHLTALAASQLSCPLVGESPVNLECRVTDIVKLGGSHDMFIADIVAVNVDEELLDEKGRLRLAKAGLCTYAHGEYFALGKKIGDFGFSVKKKKKKPQYDRRK